MKKDNLNYVRRVISNNLWPVIAALVIICSAVITLFAKSQEIVVAVTATVSALILLWYTFETQRMRKEMTSQNEISIMPVLVLGMDEDKRKLTLKNHGSFPAFNVIFNELKTKGLKNMEELQDSDLYIRIFVDSIIPKEKKTLQISDISIESRKTSTVTSPSDPDSFFSDTIFSWLRECAQEEEFGFTIHTKFENMFGEMYSVELGLGKNGTILERPKRVKRGSSGAEDLIEIRR